MSQHQIPAKQPHHVVVVGWDEPLGTFFGQVYDALEPEAEENIVLWVGVRKRELMTVRALAATLLRYAVTPDPIVRQLELDRRCGE